MSGLGSRLVRCLMFTQQVDTQITSDSQVGGSDLVTPRCSFLPGGPCVLSPPVDCWLDWGLRREHHFNAKYFLRNVRDLAAQIFLSSDNYTKMDTWIRAVGDMVRELELT